MVLEGVTLEPVGAFHAPVIAALMRASFAPVPEVDGTVEIWSPRAVAETLAMPNGRAWIAVAGPGRQPVGYLLALAAVDVVEILSIGVDPSARRQGIGRRLIAEARAFARGLGAGSLRLEMAEDNRSAADFYGSLGFRRLGTRPKYYARSNGRVAAWLMGQPVPLAGADEPSDQIIPLP